MKTALVTGGSGYLGSHICKYLNSPEWNIIVYDSKKESQHQYYSQLYSNADIRDRENLRHLFFHNKIDIVFHLAGRIEVGESMKHPTEFWDVNVGGTANLLNVMNEFGVRNIIFSSTAAVYSPIKLPINENWFTRVNSVYGNTKLVCEQMLQDSGMNVGIFRYFNLTGADSMIDIGENHEPETHLIPNIFKNLNNFVINGNDFNTQDGTCVRDYVHVTDVAKAHIDGAKYLEENGSFLMNLGTGKGHSILQVIKSIQNITGKKVNYSFGERRLGDPDVLIADIKLAKKLLKYKPKYNINDVIQTAYKWHLKQESVGT